MFEVETPGGHLVTVRWADMRTVTEGEAFRDAIRAATMKTRPTLLCADWRAATILPPPVADVLVQMFHTANPNLRRAAILLPGNAPTFAMQAERMVREAGNPQRRTFRDLIECLRWFGELTTPAEQALAAAFMHHREG